MFKIISLFFVFAVNSGFLLDNKEPQSSNGQASTGNQYLTSYDKIQINNDIEKVRQEQKGIINILTSQIQQRFAALEQEVGNRTNLNDTCRDIKRELSDLESKYQTLEQKYALLLNHDQELRNENSAQKTELTVLKNKTSVLEQELEALMRLTSFDQNLASMNKQLQTMDASINSLMIHDQTKSQDSLALYNITKQYKTEFYNFERQISEHVDNQTIRDTDLQLQLDGIEKDLRHIETNQNSSFITLQDQITINSKMREKVALTGCRNYRTHNNGSFIRFDDIRTSYGIGDLSSFKSTGIFTCTTSGLYYISATIASSTYGGGYIYKNDKIMTSVYVLTQLQRKDRFSGTSDIVIDLIVGDTVKVQIGQQMELCDASCITIMKVK